MRILTAWRDYLATGTGTGTAKGRRERTRRTHEFIQHWRAANPESPIRISKSTLYAWDRLERERGRAGLLPCYSLGPRDLDVPKEFGDLVGRYYLDRNQRKLAVCYEIARVECLRLYPHLADYLPSLHTIRRYVRRRWPQQAIILARRGESALRRHAIPSIETDFESYNVMDLWVSDHAQMDLHCITHDGKRIRPWVTDWRDFRSRKRVGWLVHEGPSADTVLASFAVAVTLHGVPRGVKFDNGRDYSGRTFAGGSRRWRVNLDEPRVRALLEHLQCEVHFSLPGNPMGKASQESHYAIDREWFDKQWASYCGRDPASRPEHLRYLRKRPDGLPRLAEVQHLYSVYAGWRNQQPHTGQGMDGRCPADVFASADYIQRVVEARELSLLLQKTSRPLTVAGDGVWIFDRWYWSETIAGHLGERVYARYNLDAIGEIYVYTLDDRLIDVLQRTDLLARGATAADARKAHARKAFVRRIAKQALEVREATAAQPDLIGLYAGQRAESRHACRDASGAGREPRAESGERRAEPFGGARGRRRAPSAETAPERQRVVELVRTPFRAAAKQIGEQAGLRQAQGGGPGESAAQLSRGRQRATGGELLEELGGGLTGKRKPRPEELADAAFAELAGTG